MELRRKYDNVLLTDRLYGWSGWQEAPAAVRSTISGQPTVMAGQKTRPRTATVMATFSADDSNSSLADLDEIRRLHHRNQYLTFRDREDVVKDVLVLGWEDAEPFDGVFVKTIVNVTLTLLDVQIRW